MPFKYIEEIAMADVAFEATGGSLEELFTEAARAVAETMIDIKDVKPSKVQNVELENEKLDMLLFDWLQEQVILKDSDALFFSAFTVTIKKNKKYQLSGELRGEVLDPKRHTRRNDVKAVTMHQFAVEQRDDGWWCRVVLDI